MLFSGIASNIDNNKIIAATTETTAKIYGDVTKDGKLDILDSISLTNYVLNSNKPISSNFDVSAADLDGDGVVNTIDVILMKHFITNSIDIFPVEADIDSDGDGLSDYIEKNITKTDPKLKDTDSDGLSDGEEIMITNTNPLLKDTDSNGINDGDDDPDKDGLKNIDEIKYTTNPLVEDTDEDGLNDGDEINKHKTSPLVDDTDEDGLDDYEEIILGLNPLNKASKGVADNLYTLEQTVKADNEILKDINKAESPYSFSANGKVSGLMENRLLVNKSGYTNVLQSDSIVGDILDISYDENVKMEKVKIDFSIKTATDINKYMIFRYYEDLNILLPEETFYNTTNKSIYIETDELGTFCVMDTEAWALSINSEMPLANQNNVENSEFTNSKEIEVFFVVYTDADVYTKEESELQELRNQVLEEARTSIAKASTILIDNCNKSGKSIKIYYISNSGLIATNLATGTEYVDNNSTEEERLAIINRVGQSIDKSDSGYWLDNVLNREMKAIALSNKTSLKYCFIMDINSEPTIVLNKVTLVVDELKQNGMYFTFIYDKANRNSYDYNNFDDNENKYIWLSGLNNVEITSNYILKTILPEQTFYEYKAGNLLGKIVLEAPIIQDYYKAYTGEIVDFTGFADSDKDGVYDFQEINFKSGLIKFDEAGNLILPKYNEICAIKIRAKLGYDVLFKKYNNNVTLYNAVKDLEVLLLTSHPNKVDSDGDYYPDSIDREKNKHNPTLLFDEDIDDSNSIKGENPSLQTTNYTNGTLKRIPVDIGAPDLKNAYLFPRDSITIQEKPHSLNFQITPKENGDYAFSISNVKSAEGFDIVVRDTTKNKWTEIKEIEEPTYANGVATYYYSLKAKVTYNIYMIEQAFDSLKYEVTISQNNWAYAPNGGYDYSSTGCFKNESIYMDGESIYGIIKEARQVMYNETIEDNLEEYLDKHKNPKTGKIDEGVFSSMCNRDAELFINMQAVSKEDINQLMGNLGNFASISGVALLVFPQFQVAAVVVTLAGGTTAVYSILSGSSPTLQDSIRDAMIEGRYNLAFTTTTSTYHPYDNDFEFTIPTYSGWKTKPYIDKFSYDNNRKNSIIKFDERRTVSYENGKWGYQ